MTNPSGELSLWYRLALLQRGECKGITAQNAKQPPRSKNLKHESGTYHNLSISSQILNLYLQGWILESLGSSTADGRWLVWWIETSTVYSPNWVNVLAMCHQKWTTTTYPKPKSLPQTPPQEHITTLTYRPETAPSPSPPGFFLDSLSSEAPEHQRRPCCWMAGPKLSPFCWPWGPQRWPAAPKASGPSVRQGQVPRRPGPWGVMGCTCSCGWVNRKSPLNWLMSPIGEFFGMIAPGFIQVLIG